MRAGGETGRGRNGINPQGQTDTSTIVPFFVLSTRTKSHYTEESSVFYREIAFGWVEGQGQQAQQAEQTEEGGETNRRDEGRMNWVSAFLFFCVVSFFSCTSEPNEPTNQPTSQPPSLMCVFVYVFALSTFVCLFDCEQRDVDMSQAFVHLSLALHSVG